MVSTDETLLLGRPHVFESKFRDTVEQHRPDFTERVIRNIQTYASHGAGRLVDVLVEIDGWAHGPISNRGIADRVAALIRRGTILAFLVPAFARSEVVTESRQLEEMTGDMPDGHLVNANIQVEGTKIEDLPKFEDKLVYVLRKCPDYLNWKTLGKALKEALTTTAIVSTVIVLAAWAASHFFGVGFAIDAVLVAIGWVMIGWGIFSAAKKLLAALKKTKNATSMAELDKAAEMVADAIVILGVDTFIGLLTRGAGKLRAKTSAKAEGGGGAGGAGKTKKEIEAENKAKADQKKKTEEEERRRNPEKPLKVGDNLHGRKITAVKQGNDDPIVLIGTKMDGDDGVIAVAEKLRAEGKNVEILEDGFLDGKKWDIDGEKWDVNSAWDDMVRGEDWEDLRNLNQGSIPDYALPETPMYKLNESWIKGLDNSGATIIDIGNPTNSSSIFYKMEQGAVTWN